MKRFALILLFVAALLVAAHVEAADRVEINTNGSLRVAQPADEWRQTNTFITKEAQQYPAEWQLALKHPGKIVPVETSVKFGAMRDLVHRQQDLILERGVKMTGNVIDVVNGNGEAISSDMFYNPYIFLWVAAIALMTLAGWLRRRHAAFALALATAAAAAFATAAAAFALATVAAVAAVFFALAAADNSKWMSLFYVAMIVSAIAFYWR